MTTLPGWAGQAAYARSLQRGNPNGNPHMNEPRGRNSVPLGTGTSSVKNNPLGPHLNAPGGSSGGFDDVGGDLPPPADMSDTFTTAPDIGDRFGGWQDSRGGGGWGGGGRPGMGAGSGMGTTFTSQQGVPYHFNNLTGQWIGPSGYPAAIQVGQNRPGFWGGGGSTGGMFGSSSAIGAATAGGMGYPGWYRLF